MKVDLQNEPSKLGYGDYLRFRELVLERSGLYFPEKRRVSLEVGLFKALAASKMFISEWGYNLDGYYELLRDKNNPAGKAELERLIHTLTIGETHFFRDEAQFNALATNVLPELIARKRAAAAAVGPGINPQLRIWSAGCATGEEPYSIAILLNELLPDLDQWHILILATDINQESLDRARRAHYSDWSFRETRAKALRPTYFTYNPSSKARFDSGRYRLRDDIRQMVTFVSLNLIEDDYPAIHNNTVSMDLILCRNVTIYFTEAATRQVVKRFYEALVGGGWLAVGHAEPSLMVYRAFQTHTFPNSVLYQKTGQPQPWPDDWDWLDDSGQAEPPPTAATWVQTGPSLLFSPPEISATPNGKSSNSSSPVPVDLYELARTQLEQGYIKEAIEALQGKLAEAPDFAPAHCLLGRAYANMGRWTEAQHWCQSALERDRLLPEVYYVLGLVYQHEDNLELAIDMLKKAIYLDRQTPLPHFNLAMLYKKLGRLKNAQRAFQNAINVLEKWPSTAVIPDSGGATAKHLLDISRRLLDELVKK